jgi:vacuolar-type H+-ATPase subunit I/STV1
MTSALFLGFVAVMTSSVVALINRYINRRAALHVLAGLGLWFLYAGLMGYFGVLGNTEMRPPGIAFLVVPVLLFIILFIARPSASAQGVLAFPLWLILGTQCFRIGVELFLHQLWTEGLVPRMMTFAGANIDIYIGLSAPPIAWLSTRGRWGLKLASAWNILGLLALLNVVTRAVLTAPGPLNLIHSEVPDRMIGTFPFLFIPGFFVPLAVVLHLLAIRAISSRMHSENGTNPVDAQRFGEGPRSASA